MRSRGVSATGAQCPMPALLITTSGVPTSRRTRSAIDCTAAGSATSHGTTRQGPPPECSMWRAASPSREAERETSTSRAPASASTRAVARPMPDEAPVTMATRPASARFIRVEWVEARRGGGPPSRLGRGDSVGGRRHLGLGAGESEGQHEARAGAGGAVDLDTHGIALGEIFHHGEPEPDAGWLRGEERVEDLRRVSGIDALARVRHGQPHLVPTPARLDRQHATAGHGLDGVVHDVADDVADVIAIRN